MLGHRGAQGKYLKSKVLRMGVLGDIENPVHSLPRIGVLLELGQHSLSLFDLSWRGSRTTTRARHGADAVELTRGHMHARKPDQAVLTAKYS